MIRVVSWTLGATPTPRSVATVLQRLRPDILLLGDLPRPGGLRRALAGTGLSVASRHGRGRSGSAVCLSERVRLRTVAELALDGMGTDRVASHAIAGVGGHVLSLLAFRLGPHPEGRLRDAERIATFLDAIPHPDVLGGDLGEGPGGPVSDALLGSRLDAWSVAGIGSGLTYPTPEPIARHDVVYTDAGLLVGAAHVETGSPVDVAARHRPVVVDIEEAS